MKWLLIFSLLILIGCTNQEQMCIDKEAEFREKIQEYSSCETVDDCMVFDYEFGCECGFVTNKKILDSEIPNEINKHNEVCSEFVAQRLCETCYKPSPDEVVCEANRCGFIQK